MSSSTNFRKEIIALWKSLCISAGGFGTWQVSRWAGKGREVQNCLVIQQRKQFSKHLVFLYKCNVNLCKICTQVAEYFLLDGICILKTYQIVGRQRFFTSYIFFKLCKFSHNLATTLLLQNISSIQVLFKFDFFFL